MKLNSRNIAGEYGYRLIDEVFLRLLVFIFLIFRGYILVYA